MTKLLYITNQICGPGGLERVISIKTSYLVDNLDYQVHILTLNQGKEVLFYEFSTKITYHNIEVYGNIFQYVSAYKNGIKKIIQKICPDIILVCDDGLKGLLLPLILKKPCPIVYERHASKNIFKNSDTPNFFQNLKFKVLNFLMNLGAKKFDRFIVLTNGNLKEWNLNNLKVIPNPLSFYPKEKSSLKNKKVIAVGNHGFQKGFDRLLKSWELVIDKHPDWHLEIYGKIDKNRQHIKFAHKLRLTNNVSFFEPVKNIHDKYKEASIYALSSRSEGFGMVLIEAMAYGLPCVSYDCPSGPKDIIKDSQTGFLVENGNINLFSEKLTTLIDNFELRYHMGNSARLKAKMYMPDVIMSEWHSLFTSILENNKL
jgi:glycosyltransferase involved in cell wall biosynthesis